MSIKIIHGVKLRAWVKCRGSALVYKPLFKFLFLSALFVRFIYPQLFFFRYFCNFCQGFRRSFLPFIVLPLFYTPSRFSNESARR